ncbi:MAG: hypothetical protein GY925_05475 [Actinomycetia bacterium]|nr:hypothetical protein [Actinomycetes bacterium]
MSRWSGHIAVVATAALALAMVSSAIGGLRPAAAGAGRIAGDDQASVLAAQQASDGSFGVLSTVVLDDSPGALLLTTVSPDLTVETRSASMIDYSYDVYSASADLAYSSSGSWIAVVASETHVAVVEFGRDGAPVVVTSLRDPRQYVTAAVFDSSIDPRFVLVSYTGDFEESYGETLGHEFVPIGESGDSFTLGNPHRVSLGDGRADQTGLLAAERLPSGEVLVAAATNGWLGEVRRYAADLLSYERIAVVENPHTGSDFLGNADSLVLVGNDPIEFDEGGTVLAGSLSEAWRAAGSAYDSHLRHPLLSDPRTLVRFGAQDAVAKASLFDTSEPGLGWQRLAVGQVGTARGHDDSLFAVARVGAVLVIVGTGGTLATAHLDPLPTGTVNAVSDLATPPISELERAGITLGDRQYTSTWDAFPIPSTGGRILYNLGGVYAWLGADCGLGDPFWVRGEYHGGLSGAAQGTNTLVTSSGLHPWAATPGGVGFDLPTGGRATRVMPSSHPDQPGSLAVISMGDVLTGWLLSATGAVAVGPVEIARSQDDGRLEEWHQQPRVDLAHDPVRDRYAIVWSTIETVHVVVVEGHDLSTVAETTVEVASGSPLVAAVAVEASTGIVGVAVAQEYDGASHAFRFDPDGGIAPTLYRLRGHGSSSVDIESDSERGRFLIAVGEYGAGSLYDLVSGPISPDEAATTRLATWEVDHLGYYGRTEVVLDSSGGRGVVVDGSTLIPFAIGATAPTCDLTPPAEFPIIVTRPDPAEDTTPFEVPAWSPFQFTDSTADYGYWLLTDRYGVVPFGDAASFHTIHSGYYGLAAIGAHPDGGGFWTVGHDGMVEAYGSAEYHGEPQLADEAIAIEPTSSGDGYFVFDSGGRVHAYGDAAHFGDLTTAGVESVGVVDAVVAPDGKGYWLLGWDGGVFSFGSARFHGSVPEVVPVDALTGHVVAMVAAANGDGYWIFGSDGGVFSFGNAPFRGSIPGVLPPGVGLDASISSAVANGDGYLLLGWDGGVFNFSDKPFLGSLAGFNAGVSGIAVG